MKIIAIIQARLNSSRLPSKVMKKINNMTVLEILLSRISKSNKIDEIIVATTTSKIDQTLLDYTKSLGFKCEAGSENNVLKRFIDVAKKYKADAVVRITGDCPLVDPVVIDQCIDGFIKSKVDYFTNTLPPTFPDGLDVEVIKVSALRKSYKMINDAYNYEHVTTFIRKSKLFSKQNIKHTKDMSFLRLTLDNHDDFDTLRNIFSSFSPNIYFNWKKVEQLYFQNPKIFTNLEFSRNYGAFMNEGQKLWYRAKKVIPGGTMLLSKNPDRFLPNMWPVYYKKAKGCEIWDLENNKFYDVAIMGVGTNVLGYSNNYVDRAVRKVVKDSNLSSLNCPEEVFLAEKLVDLHPWADMVRLARTGGEANAIAIRIARAATNKDNIAICGYHGWHDWYLSANLINKKNLNNHLLKGLETNGVPKNLKKTVFTFKYNCFEELEYIANNKNIGVIKMEVERNIKPKNNFLKKVRKLASQKNIVLIFDECTSGFRQNLGGLHKIYNVEPDIAIFGKAMGNGYGITAIVGRQNVMEAAQKTFISSTFWTERIGPTAALKTIEIMEKNKTWNFINDTGLKIKNKWLYLAKKYQLNIEIFGINSLPSFKFKSQNNLAYKTFISQEMLKKGYLASNSVYVCMSHNSEILDGYFRNLDKIFKLIKECEQGRNIFELLDVPVCQDGFQRLN